MLTPPTAEQVRTLAPDAAAARAGEELASPKRWPLTGRSETAAWGLCQGSGSSPYQVAVDLAGPAYRCSCPSRKIPCKHALGLLFVLAGGGVQAGTLPEWVATWLDSRATRAASAATRTDRAAEADPAARAKRVQSREKKVAAGIDELDRWLGDVVRRGLDSVRSEGYQFWDAMGARLVDAQASGLGRSVRELGSSAAAGYAWPYLLLEGAARLHLLVAAYQRIEGLPAPLQADVRAMVGWTTREDELDPADEVADRWLVVGRRVDDAGQVITARTWLLGESCGRMALHLAFGVEAAPPAVLAWPGQAFKATLAYYPSATPLRAAVRPVLVPDGDVTNIPGHPSGASIADTLAGHAERLSANPFIDAWPIVLTDVVPVVHGEDVLVRHADGVALPVAPAAVGPRLLAVSGGRPITLVAEWDGSVVRPLSALADARLVDLGVPEAGPSPSRDGAAAWPTLVSAALLGTERTGDLAQAPGEVGHLVASRPSDDPEHRLLAAAGIVAVRRRAGRRPSLDPSDLPSPAPPDPRPALRGAAARVLGAVMTDHRSLLEECLGLVRSSGRRLPDERLPELLAIAASNPALRGPVDELAGPRGRWLAAMVPALRDGAIPDVSGSADDAWEAASGARQLGQVVVAVRRRDAADGRRLVESRIDALAGDERAAVVGALEVGLSAADEGLLIRLLADRRADVRRSCAELLARIETSVFARRLADRARPLLASRGMVRPGIAVTLPSPDAELDAAGLAGKPPAGVGERAWLLRQVVGHVPPRLWTEWLRADPAALVERALRTDEARMLLEGWIDASGRFGDRTWAAAILAEPKVAAAVKGIDPSRVLETLPAPDVAMVVANAARHLDQSTLARLADRCPAPWPRPVVEAVFAALSKSAGSDAPDYPYYALVRAAAAAVPPDRAGDLETLASHHGQVRPALVGAIDTARLRHQMYAAFADLRPA